MPKVFFLSSRNKSAKVSMPYTQSKNIPYLFIPIRSMRPNTVSAICNGRQTMVKSKKESGRLVKIFNIDLEFPSSCSNWRL